MRHHTDRIAYTTAFVTPVIEHWLEREIAQWVHHEGSIRRPITPWALTTELHKKGERKWGSWLDHTHAHTYTHTHTHTHWSIDSLIEIFGLKKKQNYFQLAPFLEHSNTFFISIVHAYIEFRTGCRWIQQHITWSLSLCLYKKLYLLLGRFMWALSKIIDVVSKRWVMAMTHWILVRVNLALYNIRNVSQSALQMTYETQFRKHPKLIG